MPKFPRLIHITEAGEGEHKYFQVEHGGVQDIEEAGTECAIYQLVEVGIVSISKSFVKKAAKQRKRSTR